MNCARNIITANFSGGTSATTAPLWQWDYGQVLCITGIEDLPAAFEVHFSTNRTGGSSTVAVGADGQVTIPNVMLTIGKNLNAWIYLSDAQGEGETEYSILIPVKARPMPETYDAEVTGEFDDVVRQVSEYAQTAQTAADNAGASATAAAASADNAAASASAAETAKNAAETAQGEAEDAQAAAETAAQTATEKAQQTAQDATQAAQSKADAESAAQRAEAAQTGAESAKTDAETAAQSAADSASAASTSATGAGQAASAAAQSASAAAGSATTAGNAAQTATTKAGEAFASADAAAASETAAQTAQTAAETAATNAGQSASTATTKAAEAAQSASNAAASETAAEAAATRAEQAAASLTVDDALSDTSENPVQNKVIDAEVTQLKSAIDALKIVDTASGAIASFPDGAAMPMENLSVEMSPIQDLHGQDSPYPAGGGKNIMAPIAYSGGGYNFNIGTVLELTKAEPQPTVNGNTITYSAVNWSGFTFKTNPLSAGTYDVHADVADTPNRRLTFYVVGSSDNAIKQKAPSYNTDIENRTYTVEDGDYIAFFCGISPEGTVTLKDLQTEAGAFTSWSPYSNICPISGRDSVTVTRTGKNLLPNTGESKTAAGVTWTKNADGTITVSGTATGYSDFEIGFAKVTPDMGTITLSGIGGTTNVNWGYITLRDANNESIVNLSTGSASASLTFDISGYPNADTIRVTVKRNNNVATSGVIKPQLELGSTASDYVPYNGQSATIALGQTVYGGTVDFTTGTMTVEYVKWSPDPTAAPTVVDIGDGWTRVAYAAAANRPPYAGKSPITGFYSHGDYTNVWAGKTNHAYVTESNVAYFWFNCEATLAVVRAYLSSQVSAGTPVELAYKIKDPFTVQLNPAQLSTLKGLNNVWSDADSVTVDYVADPKLYIARLTEPDADMVADANITSGSYFMVSNTLYLATANIASGAAITPGVNCTKTNLAAALNAINS